MRTDTHRLLSWTPALLAMVTALAMGVQVARLSEEPYLGMSERGPEVALVVPGGPAERAGIRSGDRLASINSLPVEDFMDPGAYLRQQAPGTPVRLLLHRKGASLEVVLLPDFLPGREVFWRIAHAMVAILTLLVGTSVWLRRAGRLTGVFFGLCFTLAILLFRPWSPPTEWGFLLSLYLVELLSTLFPGLLVHFFLLFPYERALLIQRPWIQFLIYFPGIVLFTIARLGPDQLLALGLDAGARRVVETGTALQVIAALFLSVTLYVQAYWKSPLPTIRRKLKVTLAGTLLGLLPLIVVFTLRTGMPSLQIPGDRLATLMIFFLPASIGYAIVRHGIFEMEFIVKRSMLYAAMTAGFVLLYFLAFFALRHFFGHVAGFGERIGSLLAIALALIALSPLRERILERVDRWIYPDRYDLKQALRDTASWLREGAGPAEIIPSLLRTVQRVLGVERAAFFRPANGEQGWEVSASSGLAPGEEATVRLGRIPAEAVFRGGVPLLRADLEAELPYGFLPREDLKTLQALEARAFAPLVSGTRRVGLLVLGPRAYREPYSTPDLEMLEGLATQASLALENALFLEENRGREDLQREMEMARSLQQQLLPRSLPHLPHLEVAAANVPSREVGGDYYDCVPSDGPGQPATLTFAIGDVSGRGVPAALLMANVQALFRAEAQIGRHPEELLAVLNHRLCSIERPDRFVSFFCASLEAGGRRIRYANAGHLPPILIRAGGSVDRLDRGGLLLGIRDEERYEGGELALGPGDLLILFTDGVVERGGPDGTFGEMALQSFASRNRHLGAEDLLGRILEELERAAGPGHEDDTTLVVLKIL